VTDDLWGSPAKPSIANTPVPRGSESIMPWECASPSYFWPNYLLKKWSKLKPPNFNLPYLK
jgi:hypothetical protein